MKCPIHGDDLRIEYTEEGWTGICLKCPKRYLCCTASRHMETCDKLRGHEEPTHRSEKGREWKEV